MPAKAKFGRRSGGFLPLWPYPLSREHRGLSRLGCRTAKIAATLDSVIRIRQSEPKANSTEVPPRSDVGSNVEEIARRTSVAGGRLCY